MGRILPVTEDVEAGEGPRFGAAGLLVRGMPYNNTAAKFWSALVDEVAAGYPASDRFVLTCPLTARLRREMLHPTAQFEEDLALLWNKDIGQVFEETLSELMICGMPAPVEMIAMRGEAEIGRDVLLEDCIDAELFPYLLVWLLSWADLPDDRWEDLALEGHIEAQAADNGRGYGLRFVFSREHLSEGLFRGRLDVRFARIVPARQSGRDL